MTLEYVGVFALMVGFISLYRPPSFIVFFFVCATLLGSAAAFVLDSLGGTNISPAHLLLGFLTLKLSSDKRVLETVTQYVSLPQPGFWLFLTVIYSIIGAYCLPRLLAGDTLVFAVRAQTPFSIPLAPSTSNLTQSVYFTADFVCFVILSTYAGTAGGMRILAASALFAAGLNLVFAGLDLATYFTNTTELFAPIRNANYAMLDEAEIAGLKRIVGSFTEASSFASATLCYFAFTGTLWLQGIKPRLTFWLTLLSLGAIIFATSTTGYVGLVLFFGYTYLHALIQALYRPVTSQMRGFVLATPVILALIAIIIALDPGYAAYVGNFLDGVIFNKWSTQSGVERSTWNTQAFQNFVDTFGFGVGNGSVRASSFPIAVLASLGFIGALLFGIYFVTLFFRDETRNNRADPTEKAYRQAAKMACLATLITATTSGALIDLGLPFYIFAAICSGKRVLAPHPRRLALSPEGVH